MQLLSDSALPISPLDRYVDKIQTRKMNKSLDDIATKSNFIFSDDCNYSNDSSYFFNSCAPSVKENRKVDHIAEQESLIVGRDIKKGNSYPLGFSPRNTDVIVGKGMNCYNHVGNKLLRNAIVAPKLAQYAATTSKKDKSIVVTSILEQVRKNGGAFVKKDYGTGLWHDAEPFLARDKVSQTIRNALNMNDNTNKKRKRQQKEEEQKAKKQFMQMRGVNVNEGISSSLFFGNNSSNQSIITQSLNENIKSERIPITMLTQQYKKNSNYNNNNNNTKCQSLTDRSDDDKVLLNFFDRYAESFTNEALYRENDPFEPNPIKMNL